MYVCTSFFEQSNEKMHFLSLTVSLGSSAEVDVEEMVPPPGPPPPPVQPPGCPPCWGRGVGVGLVEASELKLLEVTAPVAVVFLVTVLASRANRPKPLKK